MARPCSAQRIALLEALDLGPATSRELARRAGLADLGIVTRRLDHLVRYSGHVAVLRKERVPGCKRPVPVYGRLHVQPRQETGVMAAFAQLGLALFGPGPMGAPA